MQPPLSFRENPLYRRPIRDLLLQIEGTRLESVIRDFEQELTTAGHRALQPRYALSREVEIVVGLTTYVASLAMKFVHHGSYFPALKEKAEQAAVEQPHAEGRS